MKIRVGTGFDAHAFSQSSGGLLVLGGVVIPFEKNLAGHSDADVLIHAVVDALLGAAALGDMGAHFPSSDSQWKGRASSFFLEHAKNLLRQHGWTIENVDATVIAQRPVLAPYVTRMRTSMAEVLEVDMNQVSVKAKTTDGLGFAGREEGIACYAAALIRQPS